MGLDTEKFDKFIAFYTSLETPAQVEDREDCLGAIMTWDMGMDLRWGVEQCSSYFVTVG